MFLCKKNSFWCITNLNAPQSHPVLALKLCRFNTKIQSCDPVHSVRPVHSVTHPGHSVFLRGARCTMTHFSLLYFSYGFDLILRKISQGPSQKPLPSQVRKNKTLLLTVPEHPVHSFKAYLCLTCPYTHSKVRCHCTRSPYVMNVSLMLKLHHTLCCGWLD